MQRMIERMKQRNLSHMSRATGLSLVGLYNIAHGRTKNPHYETVRKINEYLEKY